MISAKKLSEIWKQVPVNYYQSGVKNNVFQKYWHSQKLKTFKRLVGKKIFKSILDVGCASGFMTNKISEILPEAKVTGVDVYPKAIKYAGRKYPHIGFLVADAHRLPFKDNTFDLVICYETIEHVLTPSEVLREISRVVKKDGLALIVMDSGRLHFRVVWWIWEKTKGKVWKGAHLHPFKHEELTELIKKSEFKIVKKVFSHFGMEVSFLLKCKKLKDVSKN